MDATDATNNYGITHIDHTAYPATLKGKSIASLLWIISDATKARDAMPEGQKAGYYADEILYCGMEIQSRRNH